MKQSSWTARHSSEMVGGLRPKNSTVVSDAPLPMIFYNTFSKGY